MTTEQARQIFNTAINATQDADQIAKIELAREFFTNPDFRKALEDYTWQINQKQG